MLIVRQCAIPVFDGLLTDSTHDTDIGTLLFTVAEWHALAKLRIHTETTLEWLEQCTKSFGTQIRRFQAHTCTFFDTRELPSEEAARSRKKTKKAAKNQSADLEPRPNTETPAAVSKKKNFNLLLIKLHALGDYVQTIKMFGTMDSYSTQPVSDFVLCQDFIDTLDRESLNIAV